MISFCSHIYSDTKLTAKQYLGKIGLQGPLLLAQSAALSMCITARATCNIQYHLEVVLISEKLY